MNAPTTSSRKQTERTSSPAVPGVKECAPGARAEQRRLQVARSRTLSTGLLAILLNPEPRRPILAGVPGPLLGRAFDLPG